MCFCEIKQKTHNEREKAEMKKRMFALLTVLVLTVGLLAGCGSTASGTMDTANANAVAAGGNSSLPVVTWKMGSTWGAGNVHFTVDQRFSEILSQLTGGRFTVTNYAEGELCAANLCQPGYHRVRRRLGRLLVRQGHGL